MRRLSWSQFSLHTRCPFEWYGKYVMKLVPYEKYIPFIFGSAVHGALERFLLSMSRGESLKSVAEMVAMVVESMKGEGVKDPDVLQFHTLNAMNCLTAWRRWISSVDFQVLSLEKRQSKPGFLGFVDCIARVDGQLYIIDWKTSTYKYSQKRTDEDGQLTVYLWLTDQNPDDVHVAQGVLIKGLSQFQFITSRRTQEDIERFLENLQEMRKTIQSYRSQSDPKHKKGSHCQYCDIYKLEFCEGLDDF